MKRLVLFFIILFALQSSSKAQHNVIGIGTNAFSLVPRVTFERSFFNTASAIIGIEGGKYSSSSAGTTSSMEEYRNIKGFGLMPEIRYYPLSGNRPAPLGLFIGTHFRYRWLKETYIHDSFDEVARAKVYDYGFNFGYKFNSDMLSIDFLVGIGKPSGTDNFLGSDELDFTNSVRLELNIGFIFPEILY